MRTYTADQWVLFFFFYCLCGWLWESCYVSARQRRWVNRGFLHGPLLPIYGFGAIIILIFTLPVRAHTAALYVCGTAAATLLEYVTGAVMERLFKVRYWDYSNQKLNLNGYICLSSSIAWGFFSILLVRVIHPPVERLVLDIPAALTAPLTLALMAAFGADVMQSVRAALDLRAMLEKLTEENEELRRLARRAEIISAFAEDDLQKFRDRTQVERILLRDRLKAERQRVDALASSRSLRSPMNYINDRRLLLDYDDRRLRAAAQRLLGRDRERFVRLTAKLDAMSPLKVLSRGYSLAHNETGNVVHSVKQLTVGESLHIDFADGRAKAQITELEEA